MDIATLQREAHAIASEQGWWDETTTFGDRIERIHEALSEAGKASRAPAWKGDLGWRYVPILDDETGEIVGNKPVGVAAELAEVVVRVAATAQRYDYGIDAVESIEDRDALDVCLAGLESFGDWIARLHWITAEATSYKGVASEHLVTNALASLVVGVQHMAAHYEIDLDATIEAKMEYLRGATR